METKELGIISLLLGIFSLFSFFVVGLLASLPLGIIAIIAGYKPKKEGNKYGKYGVILGTISVILFLLTFVFAAFVVWFW
ncbi:hypothetical protein MBGDF03_00613 [Thermoplasmatales archaeon SCGC AB-540-F20]|nr:hypothetical protein MBGDF03_00613 [Thermoplasmatales archaeon SCGC AB-540-F20]